jgi:hypothetical protein
MKNDKCPDAATKIEKTVCEFPSVSPAGVAVVRDMIGFTYPSAGLTTYTDASTENFEPRSVWELEVTVADELSWEVCVQIDVLWDKSVSTTVLVSVFPATTELTVLDVAVKAASFIAKVVKSPEHKAHDVNVTVHT